MSTEIFAADHMPAESRPAAAWSEPIAIVGIGCRFPGGVRNTSEFWSFLSSGRTGIVDIPGARWNRDRFFSPDGGQPATMYVRKGGFIDQDVETFDAGFFGISPREAVNMDPQQRLLLEVAWEAMEDAGLVPLTLAGTQTGVYIGGFTLDHLLHQMSPLNRHTLGSHAATGSSMTMLSNRLSYVFDFRGPSLTVDTACSASLVAFHLACQGLQRGECTVALAGGVNIMLRPEYGIVMSKGRFLAADGYCKSFDARANGYARGEGAGVVVLKPLSDAIRDGDEIYAQVEATGVNQDGRTDGITVPNPDAQEALIRRVYGGARIALDAVRYVEAHGTGTAVGDPIEASALGRTIGAARNGGAPCIVGSVKAAIGHLEAAAGIAGVIKTALCLHHEAVPAQPNLQTPNPDIPFDELGLRLPMALEPLSNNTERLYAGINSFGYGGTNAHAVLAPVPRRMTAERRPASAARPLMLPLSARSSAALVTLAQAYADRLAQPDAPSVEDICFSAATCRMQHDWRLAAIASSAEALRSELLAFVEHGHSETVVTGRCPSGDAVRPAFVFSGMGPQWWAMGRELFADEPVFREAAEEIDAVFRSLSGWSILDEMRRDEASSRITRTEIAQPANFVVQVGLARLLASWGVRPQAIVGHSVGEVSAAHVAGVLDLEDAVRVSYHRSRLQQRAAGRGGMLATGLGPADARAAIAGREHLISIAAVNSPGATTLSGDPEALAAVANDLEARSVFHRALKVEVAYHSPHMDELAIELSDALVALRPRQPGMPLYSTVSGRAVDGIAYDAAYWRANIREPVRFADAIGQMMADGYSVFLEVGPHPVLAPSIRETAKGRGAEVNVFASLRRETPETASVLLGLGSLHCRGADGIDWTALCGDSAKAVKLPSYPWQRTRYWSEAAVAASDRLGRVAHPLLGLRIPAPAPTWQGPLNLWTVPYLTDHVVQGAAVFPGAGYVEQALAVGALLDDGATAIRLENVEFQRPLVVANDGEQLLRVTFDDRTRECRIYSAETHDAAEWTLHASARIMPDPPADPGRLPLDEIRSRCREDTDAATAYARFATHGLRYGPWFQRITSLSAGSGEALAGLSLPPNGTDGGEGRQDYRLHPTVLDGALQSLIATVWADVGKGTEFVPTSIRRISVFRPVTGTSLSYARVRERTGSSVEGDVTLCASDGAVIAEVVGLQCRALQASAAEGADRLAAKTYVPTWQPARSPGGGTAPRHWLVLDDDAERGGALAGALQRRTGGAASVVGLPERAGPAGDGSGDAPAAALADGLARAAATMTAGAVRDPDDGLGIVCLWPTTADGMVDDASRSVGAGALLRLAQAVARRSTPVPVRRLFVVTRGAQRVADEPLSGLAQALSIGLGRTAISEYPEFGWTMIDLDAGTDAARDPCLVDELLAGSDEDEVAFRGGERYVRRLVTLPMWEEGVQAGRSAAKPASDVDAFRLEVETAGRIESLRYRETALRRPGPGEVQLQVRASALNFKDVLKVLGMLPDRALEGTFHKTGLGMEAAAVVTALGEGVSEYAVGDEIVASVADSFSSRLTVPTERLFAMAKPSGMTFPEAASLPVIFMTAHYALQHVARLAAGETVLIHAAAGGVGLAAIQVARHVGADIIATAGSEEKRAYLRELGIEHVLDSRSLAFGDQVLEMTGGRGVDVVLNSISGETQQRSLSLLAPLGRFVEIGKRDIVENGSLPMLPFNRNLSFSAIDLDRIMAERPQLVRQLLGELRERFAAGVYRPTPVNVFGASEVVDGFRYMAQSKQIGKIVISFEGADALPVVPAETETPLFAPDGTYLVTGGLGGFGRKVATWALECGARSIALVGRAGAKTEEALAFVAHLQAQGASVRAFPADLGREDEVRALLTDIEATMPALRGVFHAAGVLDDSLISGLDGERFARVVGPKAAGAWFLHKYTEATRLDHFVLFSSVSALTGNKGQANYVAANAYLDALAEHRRALGMAATSINWGALGEVGMAARDPDVADYLGRIGIIALPPSEAVDGLAFLLRRRLPRAGFMSVDWAQWRKANPTVAASPRFARLIGAAGTGEEREEDRIRAQLLALEPHERESALAAMVSDYVSKTMRLPSDTVDVDKPLNEMGIDSLMAVELETEIQMRLGVEYGVMELMKGGTIKNVAGEILARMDIPRSPAS